MSDSAVTTYIEKRIVAQVGFSYPEFLVDIRNVPEDQSPKRVDYLLIGGRSARSTLGAKWDRHIGILQMEVIKTALFCPWRDSACTDWCSRLLCWQA